MNVTLASFKRNKNAGKDLEEKLDESIFYCLNILIKKYGNLLTPELKSVLSKNMFLKCNTKAFIHVTHFLFTILDPKECKKRFYWPIFDKNAENAYRTSVVEYINHLIERQKLKIGKIKMHMVVIPGGLKFMEFLLTLINLVIREDLERSKAKKNISLNFDEAVKSHQEMVQVSQTLNSAFKEELVLIQEKIATIDQFLVPKIFETPQEDYPKFLFNWHQFSKYQKNEIDQRNSRMEQLVKDGSNYFQHVNRLLDQKLLEIDYKKIDLGSLLLFVQNQFPEFNESFEEIRINNRVSFKSLFKILEIALPHISNFIRINNFSQNEALKYEIREVTKLCKDGNEISSKISGFSRKYFAKAGNTPEIEDEVFRVSRDTQLKSFLQFTPKITLDCSENCAPASQKSRLPLIETSDSPLQRVKLFRIHQISKTPKNLKDRSFFGTPSTRKKSSSADEKENAEEPGNGTTMGGMKIPSRRRNARDILGKIINVNRQKANLSPSSFLPNPLSSTMLSPDRRHFPENPNISGISSISRISSTQSPILEDDVKYVETKITKTIRLNHGSESPLSSKHQKHVLSNVYETSTTVSPNGLVFNERSCVFMRNGFGALSADKKLKTIQLSPSGKLETLVMKSSVPLPAIMLNDGNLSLTQIRQATETLATISDESSDDITAINQSRNESAQRVKNNINFELETKNISPSLICSDLKRLQIDDNNELLSNISDTLLMELED